MIKYVCDKCGGATESKTPVTRLESLVPSIDSTGLGLEITPIFNGGQAQDNHLCPECVADMVYLALQALPIKHTDKTSLSVKQMLALNRKLENDLTTSTTEYGKLLAEARSLKEQGSLAEDTIKKLEGQIVRLKNEVIEAKEQIKSKHVDEGSYLNDTLIKLSRADEARRVAEKKAEEVAFINQEMVKIKKQLDLRVQVLEQDLDRTKAALATKTSEVTQVRAELTATNDKYARELNMMRIQSQQLGKALKTAAR